MDQAQQQPSSTEASSDQESGQTNPFSILQQPDDVNIIVNTTLYDGAERDFMCCSLYNAAASGKLEAVVELLEDTGEGVSSGDLHSSCHLGEVTVERNTVLHIAAGFGYRDLAEVVCGRDTSLLVSQNSRSETPMLCAARAGHLSVVSLLISLAQQRGGGALDVLMKRNHAGNNALHEAARHGHREVAEELMEAAPELASEVNQANMSPLYLAVMSRYVGVVRALIQYENASFAGPNQQTALHAAVLQSREITSILLNWKSVLAYKRDASNSVPLHYAASDSDIRIVKLLLDFAPSTVYLQDEHGRSPIHVAARMGHVDVIDLLIKICPDSVEILDEQGRNFLHAGIERGKLSVASYVRRRSGLMNLINEQDNRGNTPLHLAVINQDSNIVFQLLKVKGIQTSIMDIDGHTPLDLTSRTTSFFPMASIMVALTASGSQFSSQRQDHLNRWNGESLPLQTSKHLTIVAVLIATIAFSATFNVPGGYNGDGKANVCDTIQYKVFMVFDTIAMGSSVIATILLVAARVAYAASDLATFIMATFFVWIALVSMSIAFVAAVLIGMGKHLLSYFISWVSIFAIFLLMGFLYAMGCVAPIGALVQFQLCKYKEKQQHTRRAIERQYKPVFLFVKGIFWFILVNLVVYVIISIVLPVINDIF